MIYIDIDTDMYIERSEINSSRWINRHKYMDRRINNTKIIFEGKICGSRSAEKTNENFIYTVTRDARKIRWTTERKNWQ
jgi:hypothetical protein